MYIPLGLNENGELGTEDNEPREIYTKIGRIEIMTNPSVLNIPVNMSKDVIIALGSTFNLKTDIVQDAVINAFSTNEKEAIIAEIPNVDNTGVKNAKHFKPNYNIFGSKIGRVNIVAKTADGKYEKNIWANVVNEENAEVAAKVVNGNGFTATLRSNGEIYAFGNINGSNSPEKIEMPEKAIDISAGQGHILILGKSGEIYSYGANGQGQLGTGNTASAKAPVKINIGNIEIAKVGAYENTSFAIDKQGKAYAFGEGYGKVPSLIAKDKNIIDISKNYYLTDERKSIQTKRRRRNNAII